MTTATAATARTTSDSAATSIEFEVTASGVVATLSDGTSRELPWRWLLDHGEDPDSYDHSTRQRRVDALGADPATASSAQTDTVDGQPVMALEWPDRSPTWISLATIHGVIAGPSPATAATVVGPGETLWGTDARPDFATVTVDQVLADDDALTSWLSDLARWGVARLSGFQAADVPAAHRLVDDLAGRIGYVRHTVFGSTWDLASDVDLHDDTAYSQTFLAPHTDGTYCHDAPGLQMFCCIDRDGAGGESIIVDGFAVADTLAVDHPDDFATLTGVAVAAHYIEPGIELRSARPALRLDATGRLVQVSLNNYDRSPMLLEPAEMERFYTAYGRLQHMADDPNRWLSIRLEAGDVLINDNWRVLHGRQAYTGARRFVGCYLNHEDFESRCRSLAIPTRWD